MNLSSYGELGPRVDPANLCHVDLIHDISLDGYGPVYLVL